MNKILFLISFVLIFIKVDAQEGYDWIPGKVTYFSSQYVYLKFDNTSFINQNDTLYKKDGQTFTPALIAKFISSRSCAAEKIIEIDVNVDDDFFVKFYKRNDLAETDKDSIKNTEDRIIEKITTPRKQLTRKRSDIDGRVSVSSYSTINNYSNSKYDQRWRYLIALNGDNVSGSKFSFDSYIRFSYRNKEWQDVKSNFGDALRIYNLSLSYDFNTENKLYFGRRINPNIANIGSIDGIQYEHRSKNYLFGGVVGSRPNYSDYGYNIKMFQYGVFVSREDTVSNKFMKNNLAVMEQTNNFNTDRRFLYFQHNNNIINNIHLFLSSEFDLYEKRNGVGKSKVKFTSLYLSVRYSPERWLSFTTSYDARKNVIYYETYQSYADSLLDAETRQGLRFRTNVRPFKYFTVGASFGYRFQSGDRSSTRNYGLYTTYSRIPYVDLSSTVNLNFLQTSYVDGGTYGIRFNKYIFDGMLNVGSGYRRVDYTFTKTNQKLAQNIFFFDIGSELIYKIYFSLNYEGTFEEARSFNRYYLNISKRF
ncbi:MAG: hypothetical protein K9J16_07585 [Melioribacteraceae bacterium]|nr:hypothetical protein [Melioribacteraceae bacterium]MCF8353455.1 hypothetical protein [Melioribacteraceae bacterium]MCF8393943.1 hypothetical protein [Melioribacteraceae bacterium]MCF8419016.1 hypothetical protein [Melioribacteraceae bacterium]